MKQKLLNFTRLRSLVLLAVIAFLGAGQAWGDETDEITASDLAATGTSYTDFSNVSKTSDAVYAGNSAKDGSSNIQLRSKNSNSGIVSTTSGGTVKSVKITVGSGSNTIDVYGSNTAYTSASDLYGNNKGTKVGSLTATGTVTFTDAYAYIGIRSNNGAVYISSIEIVWETGGSTPTPTYTVTYDSNGGSGTMTDENSPYEEDDEVTLLANTFTAPEGKMWSSWSVKDASNNTVSVSNGKFNMPASNVTVTAQWADDPNAPQYNWVLTDFANLTSTDIFVIVGYNGSNYAMKNDGGASAPAVSAVTIANGLITSSVPNNIRWNISGNATDGYVFIPNGSTTTTLYCIDNNNGLRVGAGSGTYSNTFFMDNSGYLKATIGEVTRYVGIYNSSDWRCYTSPTTNNIKDQTFTFYKRVDANATIPPTISADNVNIEYDDEAGQIAFTVNNGVQGGSISASTQANWITLGTETASPISFTCSANSESTVRTATVTLTYTYNTNETVTKEVTITQAAAPVIYTTIPALFAAATSTETEVNVTFSNWVVSGISTNGKNVYVTDNSGNGFIIYFTTDMSSTFAAGDILSGTAVTCRLKTYNGAAELVNLDANDLTISNGGTVTTSSINMANLSGINTGALVSYDNLTCTIENNKYYLSDGTTTLQAYNTLYAFNELEEGKTYNITGVYVQYNNTKEIAPRSAADIEEVAAQQYTLTVGTLNHVDLFVYDASDYYNTIIDTTQGEDEVQVYNGVTIGISVDVESGYQLESLIVNGTDVTSQIDQTGLYEFTMPASNVTIEATATVLSGDQYALFSGNLVEGDYIIYYNGKAMNTTVSSNRLQYAEVTPVNDVITTDKAEIVWHIAPSATEGYWTIYNADADAYAAATGTKSQAKMLDEGTDDKALWSVSGTETYEFVNKNNDDNSVNANLRNNGTYGFACYATGTGGALSLYKKVEATPATESVTVGTAGYTTYVTTNNVAFPTGVNGYIVTSVSATSIHLEEILAAPASTPVVIKATAGDYDLEVVDAADCDDVSGNMLLASDGTVTGDGTNLYALSKFDGVVGFNVVGNGVTIPAGKAYLDLSGTLVKGFLPFEFDSTDAIETVPVVNENSVIYNLAGQRLMKPQRGVNIINGHKIVVK